MKYEIRATEEFSKWASKVRDRVAQKAIATRIARAENGNLGDVKSVGGSVSEMRIKVGKGYRVYFTIRKNEIIFLLSGGDKSSQQKDIKRAKEIVKNL